MPGLTTNALKQPVYPVLFTISFTHLLNDMMQSVIPAVYPLIKTSFNLSFSQIGLITFAFQLTASLLQPFVGSFTDRHPQPYSLAAGMASTLAGLVFLSMATGFTSVLLSVCLIGMGSSVFHPESSRVAQLASGGKKGMAQSLFQLGGNAGSAAGPLLAALIVVPYGQKNIRWFGLAAVLGIIILYRIGNWYRNRLEMERKASLGNKTIREGKVQGKKLIAAVIILLVLIFSKYFYMASMSSYFTFYLIDKFHVTVQQSQFYLFGFLGAVAAGTMIGGPLGDRIGRKYVIWFSILGAAPFTLMLPYANLFWTGVLAVVIGVIIASAFSAILVYATELVPGKVGLIAGLFFGFAFGMGGIGSAVLGHIADLKGISFVYHICSFLPLIGIIAALLPDLGENKKA
ncbi:MAG: MFS transporter [Chitinophagaceae bacterium]